MKPKSILYIAGFLTIICFINFNGNIIKISQAAQYKNYLIKKDQNQDILCEPHIVEPNEYLIKFFRQKGEISYNNFNEFLNIFKRINPHITNIDLIKNGQEIFIPLKKLEKDSLPGQSSGVVSIPFVNITNVSEIVDQYSSEYEVQEDDCVSKIVAKNFGNYGTDSYKKGLKIFELANSNTTELYVGQKIKIINSNIKTQPWYNSLFDNSGKIVKNLNTSISKEPSNQNEVIPISPQSLKDDTLKSNAISYLIKRGDTISFLLSKKLGDYGSKSFNEGVELFKHLNPQITDLSHLKIGSRVLIPEVVNQPWYKSQNNDSFKPDLDILNLKQKNSIEIVSSLLDTQLLNNGIYYFPKSDQGDFELDISKSPILVFKNDLRIILNKNKEFKQPDIDSIKSFWEKNFIIQLPEAPSVEKILTEIFNIKDSIFSEKALTLPFDGISFGFKSKWILNEKHKNQATIINIIENANQRTNDGIKKYLYDKGIQIKELIKNSNSLISPNPLIQNIIQPSDEIIYKNAKKFISDLLKLLSYSYKENTVITFFYAGIKAQALSNLIYQKDAVSVVVDFGNLYGDTINSIEKTGLKVVKIIEKDDEKEIINKICSSLNITIINNPVFFAANRFETDNISLTIAGQLIIINNNQSVFFHTMKLNNFINQFLKNKGIKSVIIKK